MNSRQTIPAYAKHASLHALRKLAVHACKTNDWVQKDLSKLVMQQIKKFHKHVGHRLRTYLDSTRLPKKPRPQQLGRTINTFNNYSTFYIKMTQLHKYIYIGWLMPEKIKR